MCYFLIGDCIRPEWSFKVFFIVQYPYKLFNFLYYSSVPLHNFDYVYGYLMETSVSFIDWYSSVLLLGFFVLTSGISFVEKYLFNRASYWYAIFWVFWLYCQFQGSWPSWIRQVFSTHVARGSRRDVHEGFTGIV